MRVPVLAILLLLGAGCVGAPDPEPPTTPTAPTPDTTPTLPATPTLPTPAVGEREETRSDFFALLPDRSLGLLPPAGIAEARVPEMLEPTAFYRSFAQPLTLTPWSSPPFDTPFETVGDIEFALTVVSDSAAISVNPKAAGFPAVGAWFGTPERYAMFVLAQDAPDSLEAGIPVTVRLKMTPPPGGFFVRAREPIAIYPFLAYQGSDGRPASYLVGGPEPAGAELRRQHFAFHAPRAIVLAEETGELGPNPAPTGDAHNAPVTVPITIPPEAVYVEMRVSGAPKAGSRIDIDGSFRTSAGEVVGAGSSPHAEEVVVLGPGNLRAAGRELVAHITCGACASGATWAFTVTAYAP